MSGYTADAISHHGKLDERVNLIQKQFSFFDLASKLRDVLTVIIPLDSVIYSRFKERYGPPGSYA
jgi:hypothetical protein